MKSVWDGVPIALSAAGGCLGWFLGGGNMIEMYGEWCCIVSATHCALF